MHVVQLVPEMQEGGVERGVVEMNRELVRRGVQSTVISCGGRLATAIEDAGGWHVTMDVCSKNLLTAPGRAHRLRQALAELRPDLVHVRSRVPAWLLRMANRTLHLPVVSTVHGFNHISLYSRIMTQADRVICVSHAVRDYVQRNYRTPDRALRVIHRGVDAAAFDPACVSAAVVEAFRQEHGLVGKFVATSVGRLTPLKDYETFIRGVALARKEAPSIVGVIVGGTHPKRQRYATRLQALVLDLGLEDVIHFAGSRREVDAIYALSDVVVSCSSQPESFGRSLAEALAMETPVIATAHGGALEIVRPSRDGFLFPPQNAEALARCLLAVSQHDFSGLRASVLARFSLDAMVEQTLAVYREVLAEKAAAPLHPTPQP